MEKEILKRILKEFTLEDALEIEQYDRQYKALEKLYEALNNKEVFFKLVLTNALLSYQLPVKGEKYWENFASFFSKRNSLEDFKDFIKIYNYRFLNTKLKRLDKVKPLISKLTLKDLQFFCKNPLALLKLLSDELKQPLSAKTLVFAVKMFIYACRIIGEETVVAPFEIDIPVDVRLKKISSDVKFWKQLAAEVGIPPLHLDSIIWTTLGGGEKYFSSIKNKTLKMKLKKLKTVLDHLKR